MDRGTALGVKAVVGVEAKGAVGIVQSRASIGAIAAHRRGVDVEDHTAMVGTVRTGTRSRGGRARMILLNIRAANR
jgi:hypothetical protein